MSFHNLVLTKFAIEQVTVYLHFLQVYIGVGVVIAALHNIKNASIKFFVDSR